MTSKKNRHIGGTVAEHVAALKRQDPKFALAYDKLRLAQKLRRLRETSNVSQKELAARIGTTQSAIARTESGRHVPSLDLLQKLALALGARMKFALSARVETSASA
jgi:DNA-binding XRE family transcriptional regulator